MPDLMAHFGEYRPDPGWTFYHGTPDVRDWGHGAHYGIHIGTEEAARQALHAKIGEPAEGTWDGTREYGKTLLKGQRPGLRSGYNMEPRPDHYPRPATYHEPVRQPGGGWGHGPPVSFEDREPGKVYNSRGAVYSDSSPVPMDARPSIFPVRITGPMTNHPSTPHDDWKANGYMQAALKRGHAKRGYFYRNISEDEGSISAVVPSAAHLERLDEPKTAGLLEHFAAFHEGPHYHGTKAELEPGDLITPNTHPPTMPDPDIRGEKANEPRQHTYFAPRKDYVTEHYGPNVYEVEPTGDYRHDPEYGWQGGSRYMYRSKEPLRVKRKVSTDWGLPHEALLEHFAAAANPPCYHCHEPLDDEDVDNEQSAHEECQTMRECPVHGEHDDPVLAEQHRDTYTDWYYHLPFAGGIHRGLVKQLPRQIHDAVHDESRPSAERAHALRGYLHREGFHGGTQESAPYDADHEGHLGVHWTPNETAARHWGSDDTYEGPVGTGVKPSVTHIVLHAQSPDEEHIETDPDHLEARHMYGFEHERSEHEVPLKYGAPVHLTGISFKRGDQEHWHRHDFAGPSRHMAAIEGDGFPNPYHGTERFGGRPEFSRTWFHGTKGTPEFGERKGDADRMTQRPEEREMHSGWPQPNKLLGVHLSPLHEVAHHFVGSVSSQHGALVHARLKFSNPAHYPTEDHLNLAVAQWADKHYPHWHDDKLNGNLQWNYSDIKGTHRNWHEEHLPGGQPNPHGLSDDELAERNWGEEEPSNPRYFRRVAGHAQQVLQWHPHLPEILHGFTGHLRGQGHRGITYGNQVEGPYDTDAGRGGESATKAIMKRKDWPLGSARHISAIAQPEDIETTHVEHVAPWREEPQPHERSWEDVSDRDEPDEMRDRVLAYHRMHGGAYPGHPRTAARMRYRIKMTVARGYEVPDWHRPLHDTLESAQAEMIKLRQWDPDRTAIPKAEITEARTASLAAPSEYGDDNTAPPEGEIHRGVSIWTEKYHPQVHQVIHDEAVPARERAAHLMDHLGPRLEKDKWGGGGVGKHWSTSEQTAQGFATRYLHDAEHPWHEFHHDPGVTRVVFHAAPPRQSHMITSPRTKMQHDILPTTHGEREVPLRNRAPVTLTGVSWSKNEKDAPWTRHDFPQPIRVKASAPAYDGPYYHGTAARLRPGDLIEPGHKGHGVSSKEHVYLAASESVARTFGGLAAVRNKAKTYSLYQVEPTGPVEPDPDGMGHRTKHPLRVVRLHERGASPEDPNPWWNQPGTGKGYPKQARIIDMASSSGDRFFECAKGHEHWGAYGAAGLLIRHRGEDGQQRYLLQKRSPYVNEPDTWSVPGGAIGKRESPEQGAWREAREEMGSIPRHVTHHHTVKSTDCGDWAYHTVVADAGEHFMPRGNGETEYETAGVGWHTADEIEDLRDRGELHPAFAKSWDAVRRSRGPKTATRNWDRPGGLYLRFGDWPKNERSRNNVTGFPEDGVSVYDLDYHGKPEDPDPRGDRWHTHDEHCEPDCDLDEQNEDYGNDTREEMLGRVTRAERNRYRGEDQRADTGHLVRGEVVALGHDAEPLLRNVKRVGDWIDHRHLFIPGAERHRLARSEDDDSYEPPEEKPPRHRTAALDVSDYEGRTGDPSHITRSERGTIPTSAIATMRGVRGEVPGEHRNRQGEKWEEFKRDIAANGITNPIFITQDYGEEPKISEGNHRRDAAVELDHAEVPVEIRYYGHAERQGLVHTAVQDAGVLNSVNPTGSVFVRYTPGHRATAPLGPNMATLAETQGVHPDTPLKVYRGAPPEQKSIVPGDFITDNQKLAADYAGSGKVLSLDTTHGDVLDDRTEPGGGEYIYRPRALRTEAAEVIPRQGMDPKTSVITPGSLPPEQEHAFEVEDLGVHRREMTDVGKNPPPGTRVWRGEMRDETEHPADAPSAGMHWTANPDAVIANHSGEPGKRRVVWQGVVENHAEQAFPRSHPMWRGQHRSMEWEAEVRFRPGTHVKLEGAYTDHSGNPGYLVPHKPERTSPGWQWHPLDRHIEIRHAGHGASDYSELGIPREARSRDGKPAMVP